MTGGTLAAVSGSLSVVGGVVPEINPVDSTYVFNDAEDYSVGAMSSGTGRTADGSSRFDGFNLGPSALNEVVTTHPVTGSKCFHYKSAAGVAASAYNGWLTNISHDVPEYVAMQCYIPATMGGGSTQQIILNIRGVAGESLIACALASGKFRLLGAGSITLATMTSSYPIGSPFRIELGLIASGASTGHAALRFYADPFAPVGSYDEAIDLTSVNTGTAAPGRINHGLFQQIAGCEIYVDNVRKSNQSWPPVPAADVLGTDNGDGSVSFAGAGVTDNGDGSAAVSSPTLVDNGDGTATIAF